MAIVRHRVGIRGSISNVYRALTEPSGLAGWWSTTASGSPEIGRTLDLGFGGILTLTFVVRGIDPDTSLRLDCLDGPGPWKKSRLEFTLEPADGQVFVTLVHSSDLAGDDDFLYFNTKWPLYLLSLRDLIEEGKGRPSPHDIPIFFGDSITSNTT
jgi:uncharacterized protein YndB with AHSA1/START domain